MMLLSPTYLMFNTYHRNHLWFEAHHTPFFFLAPFFLTPPLNFILFLQVACVFPLLDLYIYPFTSMFTLKYGICHT
jgi:hypothetical protein